MSTTNDLRHYIFLASRSEPFGRQTIRNCLGFGHDPLAHSFLTKPSGIVALYRFLHFADFCVSHGKDSLARALHAPGLDNNGHRVPIELILARQPLPVLPDVDGD